jgi:hypothetical protein
LPRPSAIASAQIRKQHGKPEPQRDLEVKAKARAMMDRVVNEQRRGQHAAHFHHKHHRILYHQPGIEFAQSIHGCLAQNIGAPKTLFVCHICLLP